MLNRRLSRLLRYSWLFALLTGVLLSTGIYQYLQANSEQQLTEIIDLRSQTKLDAIRTMLQQHIDVSRSIVNFFADVDLKNDTDTLQTRHFIRAMLALHNKELDAISHIRITPRYQTVTLTQPNAITLSHLPPVSQLSAMTTGNEQWNIQARADHTLLRMIAVIGDAKHRTVIISDWNMDALLATAIDSTPASGLDIYIDHLRNDKPENIFTHTSRLSSTPLQPQDQHHWQRGFNLHNEKLIIRTQAIADLILKMANHDGVVAAALILVAFALLSLFLFYYSRIDARLHKEVSARTAELSKERHKLAAVVDHALDGILICDTQGSILRANPAAARLFGYDDANWSTLTIHALVPENVQRQHPDLFATEGIGKRGQQKGLVRELCGLRRDGTEFPCQFTVDPFTADAEQRFSIIVHDLTEHNRRAWEQSTLLKLRATSQADIPLHTRLKQMLEDTLLDPWHASKQAGAIFIARGEQQWLSASFGWSAAEKRKQIKLPVHQCICGETPGSCAAGPCTNPESACAAKLCLPLLHHEQPLGLLHLQLQPGNIPEEYLFFCQQAQEIFTELLVREHVRQELEESENKHRQLVENTPLAIIIATDGKVRYINPAATAMLGARSMDELLDRVVLDFIVDQDKDAVTAGFHTLQQGDNLQALEERFQRLDGDIFWGEMRGVPLEYDNKPAIQLLIQDISKRKQAEQQLQLLSYSDALTTLPNRRLYTDRLEQACSMARRQQHAISMLFIDLDRFKVINDTWGHAQGDLVLKAVAERLLLELRTSDTAARLGGDEFAVLLPDTEPDMALRVAKKLIAALKQPIPLAGQSVSIGASIGLASFPADGEDGETLLKHADNAMYHAKQNHLDIHCFSSALEAITRRRAHLEQELSTAIEKGELSLHYQSQHALPANGSQSTIIGVESLMRWHHPEMGMVSPGEFIPLAEEAGLIRALTIWALAEASRQAVVWQHEGIRPHRISVNISAAELMQENLAQEILSQISAHGAQPEWMEIEVTETAAMSQPEMGINIMRELVDGGVSIAIDDFGTGYSSLAYLKRLPADLLKIDIAFIRSLPDDAEDAVIVRTIIAMAHALGKKVIAEGVETEAQLEFLRREGCDQIQGYLLGKPLPADQASDLFRTSKLAS
ncbi:MAG: EAL domain-containing protein [Mariprofundus sp.]